MTLLTVLAFALLVVGIVGSLVPKVPGPLISLAGVYTYWWGTGFTEPSTVLLVVITIIVALAVVGGLFEEIIAARIGGASTGTATAAGVVGLVCFLVLGPVAMLVGTAVTVFILEYRRQRNARAGASAALAVILATLGSIVIKVLLTLMILVIMLVVFLF